MAAAAAPTSNGRSSRAPASGASFAPVKRSELVSEIAVMLQKMHKQSELTLEALRNLYGLSQLPREDGEGASGEICQLQLSNLTGSAASSSATEPPLVQPWSPLVTRQRAERAEIQPETTPEQRSRPVPTPSTTAAASSGGMSAPGDAAAVLQGLHVDIDRMLKTAEALRTFHDDTKQTLKDLHSITTMPELTPEAQATVGNQTGASPSDASVAVGSRSPGVPSRDAAQAAAEALEAARSSGRPQQRGQSTIEASGSSALGSPTAPDGIWSERLLRLRGEAQDLMHGLAPGTSYSSDLSSTMQRSEVDKSGTSIEAAASRVPQSAPPPAQSAASAASAPTFASAAASSNLRYLSPAKDAGTTPISRSETPSAVQAVTATATATPVAATSIRRPSAVSPGRGRAPPMPFLMGTGGAAPPASAAATSSSPGIVVEPGQSSRQSSIARVRSPGRQASPVAPERRIVQERATSPAVTYRATSVQIQQAVPTASAAPVARASSRARGVVTPVHATSPPPRTASRARVVSPGPARASSPAHTSRAPTSSFTPLPNMVSAASAGTSSSVSLASALGVPRPLPSASVAAFEVGAHSIAGAKLQCKDWVNQDAYTVVPVGHDRLFAAVFDGHGVNGQHSANLACTMFAEQASALANAGPGLESMFRALFRNVQAALEAQGLARMSGTTATAAIVDATAGTLSTA